MKTLLAATRGAIHSHIPLGPRLRRIKRHVRPLTQEGPSTGFAVVHGLQQLAALAGAGVPHRGTLMEMGTGWLPVIPLLFHVAGYERVILTDLERLMDANSIAVARDAVTARLPMIAAGLRMSEAGLMAALERPFQPDYLAPCDLSHIADASVDTLISRCVFEHVPRPALQRCLTDFRRIVKPAGAMCHLVDNSDHHQHTDHARSRIQFLTWKTGGLVSRLAALDHFGYTNRMRHSDYLALLRETGWIVVRADGGADATALQDASRLCLAAPFDAYDHHDLAILESCFVATPAG